MPEYTEPVGEPWRYNQDYHRVSDFIGVDRHAREDYGIAQKVSLIRDWAGLQGKDDSTEAALTAIQKLKKQMGVPYQGKALVDEMYQHIRLDMDRKNQAQKKNPTTPNKAQPQVKALGKPQQKALPVQKMVQQAVQQSVSGMVQNVLKDKHVLSSAIQQAVKESFK